MRRMIAVAVLILVVAGLHVSCARKEEKREEAPQTTAEWLAQALDLEKAVVKAPAGIVSAAAPLDIEFRDPVVPAHLVGTVLDRNPFDFKPSIEGKAIWLSQRVLRFEPEGYLPAGARVEAVLIGTAAFGARKKVNDLSFSFHVAEQEVLSLAGDFVAVPETKNGVRYAGTIEFAQPVDAGEIGSAIEFKGPSGRVRIAVRAGEEPRRIGIESDVLIRTDTGQSFTVTLPGTYSADGKKWERSIFLPEIGVFRVLAHSDMTSPGEARPTYGFRFSDPIRKDIDLSGFITVSPEVPYEVAVEGKSLKLAGDFVLGESYTATIAEGFPSAYGTKTAGVYSAQFSLSNVKPAVEWIQKGVYLPTDNRFRLQFRSVNVARVRVSVTEVFPENIGFFIQTNALVDQGAARRGRAYWGGGYQDLERVGRTIHGDTLEVTGERNRWVKSELDLGPVVQGKKNSAFVVELAFGPRDLTGRCINDRNEMREGDLYYERANYYENPCEPGYYYARGTAAKLLISSDVGLTVKRADDELHVFAVDVLRARPVHGLELTLYSYQNQPVETRTTDRDGYARFTGEGSYLFGASASGVALVKLDHPAWETSSFDVAGAVGTVKGTDVHIYAERGVHRPGDTVHLSAIVRMNGEVPPERQPVILKVRNPRGQLAHESRTECGFNGHVSFDIPTDLDDPTGDWLAEIGVGDRTFAKTLRIETVKPFRLKIEVDLPESFAAPRTDIAGTITCRYLFGAPAAGLRASVRADISGRDFTTEKYGEFLFSTPIKRYQRRSAEVLDAALDERGIRSFTYRVPGLSEAPGLVRVALNTNVYEKGGSFTSDTRTTTVYPYEAFVGVKNVFARGTAQTGETYQVPIVVVDRDGNALPGRRLDVTVYVNSSHWWWDYDRQDRRDFRRMESTYLAGEYTYHSEAAPVVHILPVEDRGRHLIEVEDVASGHVAGIFFYASVWGESAPEEERERNYLEIAADKNIYAIGDEAVLSFDSPLDGMALLTVEKGRVVMSRQWKTIEGLRTSFTIPITEELLPNCYASISMIQPHGQTSNDLPMRLYGVKTLYVEEESTRLPLTISAPREIRPKEAFSVTVASGARRPATCTIAIVDEGLLDLTAFETPSPWDYFFRKIGLGVRTCDNFDEILGVLLPDVERYFSIGGGEALEGERAKRLGRTRVMRFEPVVLFEEPVRIEAGGTVRSRFTMPNYVGSVRVMVVGAAGNSYASLEETIAVRQPLMILPTVPRVARPGDAFSLPVSVFAMDSTVRDVRLSVASSANLSVEEPREIGVRFAGPGELDTAFTVTVGTSVGADTLSVLATSAAGAADYTVHLPVESPNPFFTEVIDTSVGEGETVGLIPEKFGLEGTNAARIAFSRLPDIQLDKRIKYLINYPSGCLEQTVSSAFPQLFLPQLVELEPYQKQMITDNINAAIAKLSRYVIGEGFSLWPVSEDHGTRYSDWGSSYVGHFLIEARGRGYHVPDGLYDHWLTCARARAKIVNAKNHRFQAYRLFLLALAGAPEIGAMNLVRESHLADLDPLSRRLLAATYLASGQKDAARAIERATSMEIPPFRELGDTYGSAIRDRALMAYLCAKAADLETAGKLLAATVKEFSPWGWYSTQETAMAILAIGAYYEASPFTGGALTFSVGTGDAKPERITLAGYQMVRDLAEAWGKEIVVTNESANPLFVTLFVEGVPLDDRIKAASSGLALARNFFDADGRPVDVAARPQGRSFWIVYTVENTYDIPLETLALTSVLPAGWEIVNRRLTGTAPPQWVLRLGPTDGEYMDIRDDRINWFFDLTGRGKAIFAVEINPTFRGRYRLPPVAVEAIYSPDYFARIAGGSVRIE